MIHPNPVGDMSQLAVKQQIDIEGLRSIAQILVQSGYFDTKGNTETALAQAAVKVLAGREMGFEPFASMTGIHVISGKPSVSAGLMSNAVKSSARYDYRVRKMTDAVVEIEFFEKVGGKLESLGTSTFTIEDARKAGTQNINKFARNMLFARAMSNGVKWFCPDVFSCGTVYTPEELGATLDGHGEVITVRAEVAEPKRSAPALPALTGKEAEAITRAKGVTWKQVITSINSHHGTQYSYSTKFSEVDQQLLADYFEWLKKQPDKEPRKAEAEVKQGLDPATAAADHTEGAPATTTGIGAAQSAESTGLTASANLEGEQHSDFLQESAAGSASNPTKNALAPSEDRYLTDDETFSLLTLCHDNKITWAECYKAWSDAGIPRMVRELKFSQLAWVTERVTAKKPKAKGGV